MTAQRSLAALGAALAALLLLLLLLLLLHCAVAASASALAAGSAAVEARSERALRVVATEDDDARMHLASSGADGALDVLDMRDLAQRTEFFAHAPLERVARYFDSLLHSAAHEPLFEHYVVVELVSTADVTPLVNELFKLLRSHVVRRSLAVRVHHHVRASRSVLAKELSSLRQAQGSDRLNYEGFDTVIRRYHNGQRLNFHYTLYVLLDAPTDGRSYLYCEPWSPTTCFSHWVGTGRYAVFDAYAEPMTLGPQTAGDGLSTPSNLPYRTGDARNERQFLSHLAAFVRDTTDDLFIAKRRQGARPFHGKRVFRLYHMHDQGLRFSEFDWNEIERQLSALHLPGEIAFEPTTLAFRDCAACSAALAMAVESSTSTVMTPEGLRSHVHPFLDSAKMHRVLRRLFAQDAPTPELAVVPIFLFDLSTPEALLLDRFHQSVAFDDMIIAVQTHAGSTPVDLQLNGATVSVDLQDCTRSVLSAILQHSFGVLPSHNMPDEFHSQAHLRYVWVFGSTPFSVFSSLFSSATARENSAALDAALGAEQPAATAATTAAVPASASAASSGDAAPASRASGKLMQLLPLRGHLVSRVFSDHAHDHVLFTEINGSLSTMASVLGAVTPFAHALYLSLDPSERSELRHQLFEFDGTLRSIASDVGQCQYSEAMRHLERLEAAVSAVRSLVSVGADRLEVRLRCPDAAAIELSTKQLVALVSTWVGVMVLMVVACLRVPKCCARAPPSAAAPPASHGATLPVASSATSSPRHPPSPPPPLRALESDDAMYRPSAPPPDAYSHALEARKRETMQLYS